jgi:hypothetical protein
MKTYEPGSKKSVEFLNKLSMLGPHDVLLSRGIKHILRYHKKQVRMFGLALGAI